MCIWVMPLLNLIKLFTPFSVLRVYFLCLLREMCSQHNCWTCMCKESYQEREKWKAKGQFQAFWKDIYWSCRSYLRIHSGMTRSLVLFDAQLHFYKWKKKREKKMLYHLEWTHRWNRIITMDSAEQKAWVFFGMFYWVDKSSIICAAYTPVWDWCGNGGPSSRTISSWPITSVRGINQSLFLHPCFRFFIVLYGWMP